MPRSWCISPCALVVAWLAAFVLAGLLVLALVQRAGAVASPTLSLSIWAAGLLLLVALAACWAGDNNIRAPCTK